ncbi:hypothetical protein HPB52_024585 [Rhipicephalus sanguineus]|uniref:Uncharacterized protein n=1 Tax=Rhipicephalus sanguineus TaxID=34632 RepID=A0A9D4TE83_RHISA|nr:hypothetical protein HPB52_024585 [Rhipicephalus sanguineus]
MYVLPIGIQASLARIKPATLSGEEDGDRVRGVLRDSVTSAVKFQGWDLLRWASGPWEKPQPYLLVPRRNRAFPLREDRARNRVRGRAKPRRRVQVGTVTVRAHEPKASTVERVPWAQSPGINGRGVDLRDFTRADQAPSYGIDRGRTIKVLRLEAQSKRELELVGVIEGSKDSASFVESCNDMSTAIETLQLENENLKGQLQLQEAKLKKAEEDLHQAIQLNVKLQEALASKVFATGMMLLLGARM